MEKRCECGVVIRGSDMARHKRSQKHIRLMEYKNDDRYNHIKKINIPGWEKYQIWEDIRVFNTETAQFLKFYETNGYYGVHVHVKGGVRNFLVSRLMGLFFPGFDIDNEEMEIDHIDRNPKNNSLSNLRISDKSHQEVNKDKIKKNCSSKYRGVYFIKSGKWACSIKKTIDGVKKKFHLGCYRFENEAAEVYNKMGFKLFGDRFNPNIIEYTEIIFSDD